MTDRPVELLWVKGSGGDLGTLTREGLAVLRLDRLRALVDVYPGVEREDEMVAAFEYCAHGTGGAAPSIDTAMHGLVDAAHVDHLHPDAGIALATAVDGKQLTKECFGDRVVWMPWRRPGFQLGLDIAEVARTHPKAIGVILAGHGITAWGRHERRVRGQLAGDHPRPRRRSSTPVGSAEPFGAVVPGFDALPPPSVGHGPPRWAGDPRARVHRPPAGGALHRQRRRARLLPARSAHTAGGARDIVPGSLPAHQGATARPRRPADGAARRGDARLRELHAAYRDDYRAYYERHAQPESPPMRGADPAIVLVPGVGMFSYGANKQTARVAGEFYVNAINVMRGAESVSTYDPIPESEKFRIEYWSLEEAKLQAAAATTAARHPRRLGDRRRLRHRSCHRPSPRRRGRLCRRRRRRWRRRSAGRRRARLDRRRGAGRRSTSPMPSQVAAAFAEAVLAFGGVDLVVNNAGLSISKPLLETTEADWDLQHDVMAKGSFLVAREAARVMIDQGMGGDIVYVCSKNALVAGADNVAYGAAKADQAHQVRLLAAELGAHGIRVNGVNPDAVVRGSGIFAGGWGAQRAAVYGVPEDELGTFYAQRTLLKREVLPEHVAAAVFALTGGDLSLTTGLLIPVDAGVAAAFLR